jgi:transcriptional regulator with XRE-family HTH domain
LRQQSNDRKSIGMMTLTPETSRAARGLLNWTSRQLARAANIGEATVQRYERGDVATNPVTVLAIQRALEDAGVDLIAENGGGAGVRLRFPKPPALDGAGDAA